MKKSVLISIIAVSIIAVLIIVGVVVLYATGMFGNKEEKTENTTQNSTTESSLGTIEKAEDLSKLVDKLYENEQNLLPSLQTQEVDISDDETVKFITGLDNGKDLEYVEYEQFLPILSVNKKAFFVTCADYVTMEDGTGIVHIAPAFGQDDYETGVRYDLAMVNPVGEDGKYLEGPWAGTFVMDADIEVIKWLKENAKDMSFDGVVDDLKTLSPIVPYSFNYNGIEYSFAYDTGITIENDNIKIQVTEDDFFAIWDEIRNQSVFRIPDNNEIELVYALLFSLGYIITHGTCGISFSNPRYSSIFKSRLYPLSCLMIYLSISVFSNLGMYFVSRIALYSGDRNKKSGYPVLPEN